MKKGKPKTQDPPAGTKPSVGEDSLVEGQSRLLDAEGAPKGGKMEIEDPFTGKVHDISSIFDDAKLHQQKHVNKHLIDPSQPKPSPRPRPKLKPKPKPKPKPKYKLTTCTSCKRMMQFPLAVESSECPHCGAINYASSLGTGSKPSAPAGPPLTPRTRTRMQLEAQAQELTLDDYLERAQAEIDMEAAAEAAVAAAAAARAQGARSPPVPSPAHAPALASLSVPSAQSPATRVIKPAVRPPPAKAPLTTLARQPSLKRKVMSQLEMVAKAKAEAEAAGAGAGTTAEDLDALADSSVSVDLREVRRGRRVSINSMEALLKSQSKHAAAMSGIEQQREQAQRRKRRCTITRAGWLKTGTIEVHHAEAGSGAGDADGATYYRPVKWIDMYFVLSNNVLTVHESEDVSHTKGQIPLTPDSLVHATTLDPHAFQLVTPYVAVHLRAADGTDKNGWLETMQRALHTSTSSWEHLPPRVLAGALAMSGHSAGFYEVYFPTKKPLDIVLRHVGQLIEVCAAKPTSGVFVGSYLSRVQGQPVENAQYDVVMAQLTHWTPPLTLTFRTPPGLSGTLRRRVNGRFFASWESYVFALERGVLHFQKKGGGGSSEASPAPARAAAVGAVTPPTPTTPTPASPATPAAAATAAAVAAGATSAVSAATPATPPTPGAASLAAVEQQVTVVGPRLGLSLKGAAPALVERLVPGETQAAGVVAGSALLQVNGLSVANMAATEVHALIVATPQRPLQLLFRPPATAPAAPVAPAGGSAKKVKCLALQGVTIRAVPVAEYGRNFCFTLTSGTQALELQADDQDTCDRWCATLTYALAIANGGGFLGEATRRSVDAYVKRAMEGRATSAATTADAEHSFRKLSLYNVKSTAASDSASPPPPPPPPSAPGI